MRALLLALLLAGCVAGQPRVVEVPVTQGCLGQEPKAPDYKFGMGEYPGDGEAVKILALDLSAAKRYAAMLHVQMAGCLPGK